MCNSRLNILLHTALANTVFTLVSVGTLKACLAAKISMLDINVSSSCWHLKVVKSDIYYSY